MKKERIDKLIAGSGKLSRKDLAGLISHGNVDVYKRQRYRFYSAFARLDNSKYGFGGKVVRPVPVYSAEPVSYTHLPRCA